jgi:hypothetical protein
MSDFKNVSDFRKGSYRSYPYQDPTYLSFAILFDVYNAENSPLLAGPAEEFLTTLSKQSADTFYTECLANFIEFKKALLVINNEMPWYWQSMKGLERIFQHDPNDAYLGGDDAKIEIETLESLNLPIAGLMHLYRHAIYDNRKRAYILPANLRKFTMYVYVTEVRSIQVNTSTKVSGIPKKVNKDAIKGFPDNFKPSIDVENKNSEIMGDTGRPYFMVGINYCEFDMTTGTTIFADLSKSPESHAANAITITYENYNKIEARVLNGIITESEQNKTILSPAPDSEFFEASNKTPLEFAKEKLAGRISEAEKKGKEALKKLAEDKKRELEQELRNKTVNRIPSFENVFSNFVRKADNATDITQQRRNIGNAIQANVNDNISGVTLKQGLDIAAGKAINNLGNVYD